MNDLYDLMNRTSDGDPNRPVDPDHLLRRAKRRVHRRGATAVSGLAVASLAVAGGVAWLPDATPTSPADDSSQPPVVTTTSGDGAYEPVQVSREEVAERCTTFYQNAFGFDSTFVVPPFVDGPWFEGRTAQVTEADNPEREGVWTLSCEVPQADLVEQAGTLPASMPDPADDAGVRAACGQYMGWDFTGWDVVTAAGTDLGLAAVLRSSNDYIAACTLNAAPGEQGTDSYVEISPASSWKADADERDYAVWFDTDQYSGDDTAGDYNLLRADRLHGPQEASQIVLVEPDGTEHAIDVADGWYAIAEDLYLEMNPHAGSPLRIKVLAADGTVLADYADGDQVPCETSPDGC